MSSGRGAFAKIRSGSRMCPAPLTESCGAESRSHLGAQWLSQASLEGTRSFEAASGIASSRSCKIGQDSAGALAGLGQEAASQPGGCCRPCCREAGARSVPQCGTPPGIAGVPGIADWIFLELRPGVAGLPPVIPGLVSGRACRVELPNRFRTMSSGHRESPGPGLPAVRQSGRQQDKPARQTRCPVRGPTIKSNNFSESHA